MMPHTLNEGSILVVDDETSLRETFHFFLTREGYAPVLTASGYEQALSMIRSEKIDLIISDIVLEKSSGIDLLKYVRQNNIDCPFIIITGFPDVSTAAESLRFGAFDYIVKPVEKEALLRSVRLALQQRFLEVGRRQAEEERERYRLFLDAVFKSASDGIVIIDEQQHIIKTNEAAETLFSELWPGLGIGSKLGSEVADSSFATLRDDLLRVLRTGTEVKEHRFECRTPDNNLKILSICVSPLVMDGDTLKGAVIVIRDMSQPPGTAHGIRSRFHRFVGGSLSMQALYTLIENVGRVDTTVLVTGESGTGKELAAEALHRESPRGSRPLIKVDCTAIPENLLESELFGHKKGSFTGADKDRKGLLLQADGGTLFLDEIGEISPVTQLRLLRFLQERTFYPVGSDKPIVVDTRIITATNVDLKEKVQDGSFREDLYFRLKVIDLNLPPLRKRMDDVPLLVDHFTKKYSSALEKKIHGLSDKAMSMLNSYHWPGNVRELEHLIERAVVFCQGNTITSGELPHDLTMPEFSSHDSELTAVPKSNETRNFQRAGSFDSYEQPEGEEARIIETLVKCGGNKAKAARLLGIDRSTLYRKIRDLELDLTTIALE
ncbi:MAG: sigma-54-dependent Fis family transcriptional regulator [Desulfofustis sp.]|nr:sigma-54-dependent Fis family transcriptional regulator [Desulfofustis sp.]